MQPPEYEIRCYGDGDRLPDEAEEMFAEELAESRQPLPGERPDRGEWSFACVCAVTPDRHVLGGVHLDIGPINYGPLADERLAFVEKILVRPEHRRQGVGTALLQRAAAAARDAGCLHMQCNVQWKNPAGIALLRRCGFALTDISVTGGEYFAVRALASG